MEYPTLLGHPRLQCGQGHQKAATLTSSPCPSPPTPPSLVSQHKTSVTPTALSAAKIFILGPRWALRVRLLLTVTLTPRLTSGPPQSSLSSPSLASQGSLHEAKAATPRAYWLRVSFLYPPCRQGLLCQHFSPPPLKFCEPSSDWAEATSRDRKADRAKDDGNRQVEEGDNPVDTQIDRWADRHTGNWTGQQRERHRQRQGRQHN